MAVPPEFYDLERSADEQIEKLSLWSLPLKTVLSRLSIVVNSLFGEPNAVRFGPARPEAGAAVVSRLSYLTNYFATCPSSGGSIEDAFASISEGEGERIKQVLAYSHFSELVPEVRRGHYDVHKSSKGFILTRDRESARAEECDVLLTELSLPAELERGPDHRREMYRKIPLWSNITLRGLRPFVQTSYDHYRNSVVESPLLSDPVYKDCFGSGRAELRKVRAALLSIADVAISVSFALQAHGRKMQGAAGDFVFKKSLKWSVPVLPRGELVAYISEITGLDHDNVDLVLRPFVIDAQLKDWAGAGDGYWPPFVEFDDGVLFRAPNITAGVVGSR